MRSVVAKDANPGVTLPSEEVKLELDPQYVAELDGLANAYIAGRLFVFGEDSLPDDIIEDVTRSAYRFAYKAIRDAMLHNMGSPKPNTLQP